MLAISYLVTSCSGGSVGQQPIAAPSIQLTVSSPVVAPDNSAPITLTAVLPAAPEANKILSFSSSNPAILDVMGDCTVKSGTSSCAVKLIKSPIVKTETLVAVTASAPRYVEKTFVIKVMPQPTLTLSKDKNELFSAWSTDALATLTVTASKDVLADTEVKFIADGPAVDYIKPCIIVVGTTTCTTEISAKDGLTESSAVSISASAPGYTSDMVAIIVEPVPVWSFMNED